LQRTLKIVRDADTGFAQALSCIFESDAPESVIPVVGLSRCFLLQENVPRVQSISSAADDSWVTAPDCFSQSASFGNALRISETASSATSHERETE